MRGQVIPHPGPTLDYLGKPNLASSLPVVCADQRIDEAFTSENWIVSYLALPCKI